MSNNQSGEHTKMVCVPFELVEQAAGWLEVHSEVSSIEHVLAGELREALAKPVEQNQSEPFAWWGFREDMPGRVLCTAIHPKEQVLHGYFDYQVQADKPLYTHLAPVVQQGEPVAWTACGELFKTLMGARNYAGTMPVYPLFKDSPVGVDMNAQVEELRKTVRSRESLIDSLRAQLAEVNSLLREVYEAGDYNVFGTDLDSRARDALSASAKPSAPVELTDAQIIDAMSSDLNNADGGYVVDTAPDDVVKAGRALLARAYPDRKS